MDQKIATLSALYCLNQSQSLIQERDVRQLRVVLSSFFEEILSDDEYEQLFDSLEEDKYISRKGDQVQVTKEGAALAQSVGARILGETALDRLGRMIENYIRDGSKYISNLNEQLRNLQAIREGKVKDANRSLIRVAGLIIEIQHKQSELCVHNFKLDHELMRNEEILSTYP
jgi:hypothetical protein